MRLALNPFVQPRYFSSDGFKMRVFISSKSFCLFYSQIHALLFFSRGLSGSDLVKKSSENRERLGATPSSLLNSSLLVGRGMVTIQSCFLGSGINPLSVRATPICI